MSTPVVSTPSSTIPMSEIRQLMPSSWGITRVEPVNIDDTASMEWLTFFRYETNSAPGSRGGPIGAVIYAPQPDRPPTGFNSREPYRPGALLPYKLLPQIDGRGFLGDLADGSRPEVEAYDANGDGKPDLVIKGFTISTQFPTQLAVYSWVNRDVGYVLYGDPFRSVISGDAGIQVISEPALLEPLLPTATPAAGSLSSTQRPIKNVIARTYLSTPFWYPRSQIGQYTKYRWNRERTSFEIEDIYVYFLYGLPAGAQAPGKNVYSVTYPEMAVLAQHPEGKVKEIRDVVTTGSTTVRVTIRVDTGNGIADETWDAIQESSGNIQDVLTWRISREPS
ncbi:MAG: hypothetical protein HY326_05830 [Chloroflexi bacterium]|nr:hypothetical protein [Chloroflexota bacterium]